MLSFFTPTLPVRKKDLTWSIHWLISLTFSLFILFIHYMRRLTRSNILICIWWRMWSVSQIWVTWCNQLRRVLIWSNLDQVQSNRKPIHMVKFFCLSLILFPLLIWNTIISILCIPVISIGIYPDFIFSFSADKVEAILSNFL